MWLLSGMCVRRCRCRIKDPSGKSVPPTCSIIQHRIFPFARYKILLLKHRNLNPSRSLQHQGVLHTANNETGLFIFWFLAAKYWVMFALMKSAWVQKCFHSTAVPFLQGHTGKESSRRGLVLSITILFVFELKSTDTSNYTLLKTWLGLVMEGRNREAFNCFFPQIFNSIEQTMLLWKQYKFSPKYHHAHTHKKSQITVMGRHSRCLKKKKNGFPSRLLLPDCCHYMQTLWGTAVSMIQSAAHINPAINPDPRRLPRCRRPPARLQCMLGHKLPGGQSE